MEMKQKNSLLAKKAFCSRPLALSWLLLGIWLGYSALMLWRMEVANAIGNASMCITRR